MLDESSLREMISRRPSQVVDLIEARFPDPRWRKAAFAEMQKHVEAPKVALMDHLREVDPGPHLDYRHVGAMVEVCQEVLDGNILRLMVHAPPRYFKSRIIVQGLSSCYVRQNPAQFAALMFASDRLARFHSMHARENVERAGLKLRVDSKDKSLWMVEGHHGGLWITTIRGKPLGFGFRLGTVDDPLGSYEEAQRLSAQLTAESAFDSFVERGEKGMPKKALVVMHQRLGKGDLADRLYIREQDKAKAEGWTVLDLPAIARVRRVAYPASCTVWPYDRKIGEALCPKLESAEEIEARRARDPFRASAVDDQDPMETAGGGIFRRSWMPVVGAGRQDLGDPRAAIEAMAATGEIAPVVAWWQGHDFSAGGNDATADVSLAQLVPGRGIEWIWFDPSESYPAAAAVPGVVMGRARVYGTGSRQVLPDEIGTGKVISSSLALDLRNEGFDVTTYTQNRNKVARALPHASASVASCASCGGLVADEDELAGRAAADVCSCENPKVVPGRVAVLAGPMAEHFRTIHHEFTGEEGGKDDLVDAASGVYNIAAAISFQPAMPKPSGLPLTSRGLADRRETAMNNVRW